MTNHTDRAALVSAVERLGADLEQAKADVALLQRLKDAEANAKRLAGELRAAQDELSTAIAEATEAKREAEFAKFKDITVTEEQGNGSSVLHSSFTIVVTALSFDGATHEEQRTYIGFGQLPGDALSYLIEKRPDRIPASITALSPNDPYEAFDTYFAGLRRGYLLGPLA